MHTPPHADAQRGRRRAVGPCQRRERSAWAWCRCSTSPASCTACSRPSTQRRHRRADAALGSRARGPADLAPPGHALDLHPDDDHRPVRAARTTRASTSSSLRYLSGGGAAMPQAVAERLQARVRPHLRRRLRPHRNRRAEPLPTRPSAPSCSAWASRSSASTRASSTPTRCRRCRPAQTGEIVTTGRWSSRATGATRRRPRRPSSRSTASRFFRTGDLGRMDEEGYFFITDRLKRMINASGYKVWPSRGRAAAVQVPAGAGGLHHRGARRLPRRDGQGGGRAARRGARGHDQRRGHHRLGARAHGGLQGAAHRRVRRRAAQERLGQGDVAPAAGARSRERRRPQPESEARARLRQERRSPRRVLGRPSAALRCGKRPKRATMSWCCCAQSSSSAEPGASAPSCAEQRAATRCCVAGLRRARTAGRRTCAARRQQLAVGASATMRCAAASASASPAKARGVSRKTLRVNWSSTSNLRQRALRVVSAHVCRSACERKFDQRAEALRDLRVEGGVLAEPLGARRAVDRVARPAEPEVEHLRSCAFHHRSLQQIERLRVAPHVAGDVAARRPHLQPLGAPMLERRLHQRAPRCRGLADAAAPRCGAEST